MNGQKTGLQRIIRISIHPREARAIMQDDFHHFRIAVTHDGAIVTKVSAEAVRYPYSLCPAAAVALRQLVGLPLSPRVFDIIGAVNARLQCTHQFDIAALTVAAAARNCPRGYTMFVSDPEQGLCEARLDRDDGLSLNWTIADHVIAHPPRFDGINVDHGFTAWASELPDEGLAEAALVLRRAHFVARGRAMLKHINERNVAPDRGSCYVMQPERASEALRIFTPPQEGILPPLLNKRDRAWLAAC